MSTMQVTVVVLGALLSCCSCQDNPTVTLTPLENTCVRFDAPQNTTYRCESPEPTILWRVGTRQLVDITEFVNEGIIVEEATGSSNITFTTAGRNFIISQITESFFNLTCLAGGNEINVGESAGDTVMIVVYDAPPPPENLVLIPTMTELEVRLEWDRPKTLHPCVPLNYTITITNLPNSQVVETATVPGDGDGGSFTFTENTTNSCQLHEFSVSSVNDAGTSEPAVINETIPITPNIENVSRSLDAVPLLNGGFRISVSFEPATTCNPDTFPVEQYIISIEQLPGNLTLPAEGSGTITAVLSSTNFPGLAEDSYTVSVQACASFACRMAEPQTVVTSDVQRANITFLNTTVSLYCVFADSGSARGCRFVLSLADGTREEVDVSRPMAGGTVSMQCGETNNRREAYASIQVFDLESDGTTGTLAIEPRVEETMNAEDILPCEPPTPEVDIVREDTGLSAGEIVAIIIAILVVLAIVIAILAVIIWWKRREIHDWLTAEELELMVKEEGDKPTIKMLMKGIHGTGTFKRKALTREVSQQPDAKVAPHFDEVDGGNMAVAHGPEVNLLSREETPPVSTKDPVAMIKVKDASDPNHLNLVFKAANLAHLVKKWKEKARNADEIPLYCKIDEGD